MKSNDLVSIIMLSHEGGKYVRETIESVVAQTYQNWEIVFMDDNSKDDTISQMMDLMNATKVKRKNGSLANRIQVYKSVHSRGSGVSVNSALKEAKGRWIAFLNVGDVWEPAKLERQIAFMEEHGYDFSYTKFGLINERSEARGIVIGGREHIDYKEMQKCCWPGYLTVMYDATKVGKMQVRNLKKHNDYALWLNVSEKADCHLLPEVLAKHRTHWGMMGNLLLTNKIDWRYDCFRIEEDLGPIKASLYTIRNGFYGLVKWWRYVDRA